MDMMAYVKRLNAWFSWNCR